VIDLKSCSCREHLGRCEEVADCQHGAQDWTNGIHVRELHRPDEAEA